jgi:hypothetical protein
MKGFLKLFGIALLISVAIAIGCIYFVKLVFPTPIAKEYVCKEYSLTCELQKDRILMFPITFDSTSVDVYGYKICNRWYLVSTKVRGLAPIYAEEYLANMYPNPTLNNLILGSMGKDNVRIDTVDMSSFIPGLNKVVVILTGLNEVVAQCDYAVLAISKKK